MNQFYAHAIDLLMENTVDYKNIAIKLAKTNPELFCQLCQSKNSNDWHYKVLTLIQAGQKIEAIKLCREKTNYGLKEAKDIIDAVTEKLGNAWYNPNLMDDTYAVYETIIRSR